MSEKTRTPTYISWANMRGRCRNDKDYKNVSICSEWFFSFTAFLRDMGERPLGHVLDRVDNTKGYSKDNCRWSTTLENSLNRRMHVGATGEKFISAYQKGFMLRIRRVGHYSWHKTLTSAVIKRDETLKGTK